MLVPKTREACIRLMTSIQDTRKKCALCGDRDKIRTAVDSMKDAVLEACYDMPPEMYFLMKARAGRHKFFPYLKTFVCTTENAAYNMDARHIYVSLSKRQIVLSNDLEGFRTLAHMLDSNVTIDYISLSEEVAHVPDSMLVTLNGWGHTSGSLPVVTDIFSCIACGGTVCTG